MAKYIPDVNTKRWVVLSQLRTKRPSDTAATKPFGSAGGRPVCPFCEGNEHLTPPEVYRIGPGGKDTPGWHVRVVPNLFPITDIHEVIIHSTDDTKDINELPIEQVTKILTSYRDRYRAHEGGGQVLIFCNHGFHAGASLLHPHSQLVVVPKQINLDALTREPIANIVEENTYYITYCPDFSQWPYEVWIAPKEEGRRFGDTTDSELPDLSHVLQKTLQRVERIFDEKKANNGNKNEVFVYNYYIYHSENWFIRIIPRFIHRAGFELGTGLNVNIVDPVEAAEKLKGIGR